MESNQNQIIQKKFIEVIRCGHRSTVGVLNQGDYITITEKLDGANASFRLDQLENELIVRAFSRNNPLTPENNLRGFYEYTRTLNPDSLNPNYIYFGEWLVKHKIKYKEEYINQFYLFDIWDIEKEEYLDICIVIQEATRLNLNLVPLFYEGVYQSFEHLESFVGKTELGENEGEGIVVKNIDYKDRYGKQCYIKLVSESFREVQTQKAPKDPNFKSEEQSVVESLVTTARVEKQIHKMVDNGILDEQFGIEDMGIILKNMGNLIFEDIMKEESDTLNKYEEKDIKKFVGKIVPKIVKEIISKNK